MRKSRSSGSVGERGGNDPLYPEIPKFTISFFSYLVISFFVSVSTFRLPNFDISVFSISYLFRLSAFDISGFSVSILYLFPTFIVLDLNSKSFPNPPGLLLKSRFFQKGKHIFLISLYPRLVKRINSKEITTYSTGFFKEID
jgi:hypothetical protein